MKTIKISNGETRLGYEFKDLSEEAQNYVLSEQVNFEIEIMDENSPYYEDALKMEKMQTPWFLNETIFFDHKDSLIETIEANNYLFDEEGEILPILYFIGEKQQITKITFGKHICTLH